MNAIIYTLPQRAEDAWNEQLVAGAPEHDAMESAARIAAAEELRTMAYLLNSEVLHARADRLDPGGA